MQDQLLEKVLQLRRLLNSKKVRLIAVAFLAAVSVLLPTQPVTPGPVDPGPEPPASLIREVNVTEQPDRVNGQPVVAVHPDDPDIMVYISANHIPDEDEDIDGREFIGGTVLEFQCYSAFSTDGGLTWTETEFPQGDRPFCGDPYLAVDPEGVFYTAFNRLGCPNSPGAALSDPCDEGPGRVGVARSYDGGQTWTEPVDTTVFRATTPRLRVDADTGKIYVVGGVGGPSPHAVTVSDDGGLTWSDQALLPGQPFGNQIAVHDGVLATATALTVVDSVVQATEVVFYTSTDDGQTFTAHPVADSNGEPARVPSGVSLPDNATLLSTDPVPWVTADPSNVGQFAIMVPDGQAFAIYVTPDSGETWTGPTVVPAEGARKPWIEYGPDGKLGVTWRTLDNDEVNSYAAVSFDGGATFGPALRINAETHPWGWGISGGDEWSRILFEGDDVFVTWADARTGGTPDGIVARVPLSLFEHNAPADTTRPVVALSASAESPFDGNDVTLTVSATDDVALHRVVGNIYQDGALLKSTSSFAEGVDAFDHTVDLATVVPGGLPLGDYVLRYNAQDVAGNVSVTHEFPFTISEPEPPASAIREVNVTEQPDRINGQPVIAVHPDDPDIMVYISANHIPEEADPLVVAAFQCYSAFSTDGGATWTETEFPRGDRPFCGDPNVAVDPEGVFYAVFNRLGCPSDPEGGLSVPCAEGPGRVGVARSYDGGQTWTEPVDTGVFRATTPRVRIDADNGKIYVVGGPGAPSPHGISVSADGGDTWSDFAPLPGHPFGNQLAVHGGVLATATGLTVVDNVVEPTEVVFYTSTDDGQTYTEHPVTDSNGDPIPAPSGVALPNNLTLAATDPVPWVTADPSNVGQFAIMVPDGQAFAIYVTPDSGETWTGPTVVPAEGAWKPWIEYGPDGKLGVMWRTLDNDEVNAFATVSFDGGASFAPALRVNAETHRWGYGVSGGDEFSKILFEGDHVFVTFADGRTGGSLDGIVARVPLSLFEDGVPVDTTRPVVTLAASAETPFDGNDVTLTVSATDDVALHRVVGNIYQDGALLESTSSFAEGVDAFDHTVDLATVVPGGLPPGDYVLRYNAHDVAGNVSVTHEFPFTVSDRTRPAATLVAPATAGPFSTLAVQVDATDNLGLARIVANIYQDGVLVRSTQTAVSGDKAATHSAEVELPEGTYSIRYNARDLVGNVSSTGTHTFTIDTTAPTVTVKTGDSETIGADGVYQLVSFKLHDEGKIDKVVLNGVEKDLTDDVWSDVNFVEPGVFGAVQGENTLVVYDVAGNATTIVFTLS